MHVKHANKEGLHAILSLKLKAKANGASEEKLLQELRQQAPAEQQNRNIPKNVHRSKTKNELPQASTQSLLFKNTARLGDEVLCIVNRRLQIHKQHFCTAGLEILLFICLLNNKDALSMKRFARLFMQKKIKKIQIQQFTMHCFKLS